MVIDLLTVLIAFLNSTINFLLYNLGPAVVILFVGWIVGSLVGRFIKKVLTRYKIDQRILRAEKPIFKLSDIFPVIFSWAIYLIFIQEAVKVLGLSTLVTVVGAIVAFLPGLIEGTIIVVVGYVLAEYVARQIEKTKIAYSTVMGRTLFFFVIYISVALALPLVGINPSLVNNILLIIIASIGVGMAIAIGWGLRDVMAEVGKRYLKKKSK